MHTVVLREYCLHNEDIFYDTNRKYTVCSITHPALIYELMMTLSKNGSEHKVLLQQENLARYGFGGKLS